MGTNLLPLWHGFMLVLAATVFAPVASAQENGGEPPHPDQNIGAAPVDGREGGAAPEGGAATEGATSVTAEIAALKARLAALEQRLETVEKASVATTDGVNRVVQSMDQLARQVQGINNVIQQIAELNGSQHNPNVFGAMATNRDFRYKMGRVLQGRVIVENNTQFDQQLRINGVLWRAPVGRSYTWVPFGPVTTELVSFEQPREWAIDDWRFDNNSNENQLRIAIQF